MDNAADTEDGMTCLFCGGDRCQPTLEMAGGRYLRITFGDEHGLCATGQVCRDCGTTRGQPHHLNCCLEQCPACKGQLISCPHASLIGVPA